MTGSKAFVALIGACVVLALFDVINLVTYLFKSYGKFAVEDLPNFYGFFGLVMVGVLLLADRLMRAVLMRKEDYYDNDVD